MENYFNYFTEIEEHFQQRRGSILLLSTLDWALIETWREAGIPLEAVLRGIDDAFDKYEARKSRGRMRQINGLAWCTQAIMEAVEAMKEASVGTQTVGAATTASGPAPGFEPERIVAHLERCAGQLETAQIDGLAAEVAQQTAARLRELALNPPQNLEELERNLTVLEEKLFNALTATASENDLLALREESARELTPYRSRMKTEQIRQVEQQFLRKRLLEKCRLPRLSLFYMSQQ